MIFQKEPINSISQYFSHFLLYNLTTSPLNIDDYDIHGLEHSETYMNAW